MFLEKIVATKQNEVERLKAEISLAAMEKRIAEMPACLGFIRSLTDGRKRETALIAEVKKASPSKGLIRGDFDPVKTARSYESAGTDCVSVLTDTEYFQGSTDYLRQVRAAVGVPILRKDFTIDPRQIYEARMIGADAVLLIAAILSKPQIREYLGLAEDLGLDALVEVHDDAELETVLELDAALIGINNRDLRTFVTDIRNTEKLIDRIPKGKTIVSESGISSPADIAYLHSVGAHAVLIGEYFMRQPEVERAVFDLMGDPYSGGKR